MDWMFPKSTESEESRFAEPRKLSPRTASVARDCSSAALDAMLDGKSDIVVCVASDANVSLVAIMKSSPTRQYGLPEIRPSDQQYRLESQVLSH